MTNKITFKQPRVEFNIEGEHKANKKHKLTIQRLLHELYEHECKSRGIRNERTLESMFSEYDYIDSAKDTHIILCDGKVAGMYMLLDGRVLCNLIIREKYRRKGIGKYVIETHLAGKELFLDVRESNEDAMAFYEDMGFEVIEDWHNFYTLHRAGEVK